MKCTAINPNICCVAGPASSARVSWVPVEWNINAMGYGGGGCSWTKYLCEIRGRSDYCMGPNNRDDYTGAYCWFVGRKRGGLEENRICTGSVKPDTLVLADGTTKYNIVDLDDAKIEELVSILFILATICLLEPLSNWSPHSSLLLRNLELGPKGFLRSFRRCASRTDMQGSPDTKEELMA